MLSLAGCSTGAGYEALASVSPSSETTSSIVRAVVPSAAVGVDAGYASASAVSALAEDQGLESEAVEQVAMIAPQRPSPRPEARRDLTVYSPRFRDAHPIDFGRVTPGHHAVHGVDVSRWQGDIDWAKLRSHGANFAFIKATDGGDHLDPMFMTNWKRARQAGVPRGAYHFFYWCRVASEQAEWFIRNVPKEAGALPPVIDVEWNHQSSCKKQPPREKVLEKMQVFMDMLERHYGQRPIIYTSPDFYDDNLKGAFKNHPFWLRSVAEHPAERYPGRDWVFWQYSGTGLSKGVGEQIDLNVFNGNEAQWRRWLGRSTTGGLVALN
jgi:lysozyme